LSYQRTSEAAVQGRDTESAAFKLVTRDLESATEGASRIRALGRNHLLWSLLVKDMSLTENGLPGPLKDELINLGLWSMRYSTLAVLRDLPIEPLVAVNRNILSGLLSQRSQEVDESSSRLLPVQAV
jgi:flagellar protein FlaF